MNGLGEALRKSAVINLTDAVTMVVDGSPFAAQISAGALLGFGIPVRYSCRSATDAMEILTQQQIDLVLADCEMPVMSGYELIHWLRRSGGPNAFTPVILTAAHIRKSSLARARDCGANFVITKPFSASSLLERIVWVARDERPFLEVGDYFGPDRRFRDGDPPGEERRSDRLGRSQSTAPVPSLQRDRNA